MEYIALNLDGIKKTIENPLTERECPLHGKFMAYRIFPHEDIFSSCPQCNAKRDEEVALAQEQEKRKQRALHAADYERMNVPPLFYREDFDTFETDTEELIHNAFVVKRLCEARKGKILMIGKNGTGKTHLAIAALKQFSDGRIYTRFEINLLIRQTYNRGENREKEILDSLISTPLLVIDEFEKTSGSKWEHAWSNHIFNKRHEQIQPTIIIISHLDTAYPEKKNGKAAPPVPPYIERLLGSYIMSRIIEDGIILYFTGRDRRMAKRRSL